MGHFTKRTDRRRQAVLRALRLGYGLGGAAAATGLSRRALIDWRRDDPTFGQQCIDALEDIADIAEQELFRRGTKGGDTLALLAWLRAHRPEKYHRRMLVAEETIVATPGAMIEQRTMVVDGEAGPVVNQMHIGPRGFRLPDNRRHQPEDIDADGSPTIEGEAA
jgi:hypothetical protein